MTWTERRNKIYEVYAVKTMRPRSTTLLLEDWRTILCDSELITSVVKAIESNTELVTMTQDSSLDRGNASTESNLEEISRGTQTTG